MPEPDDRASTRGDLGEDPRPYRRGGIQPPGGSDGWRVQRRKTLAGIRRGAGGPQRALDSRWSMISAQTRPAFVARETVSNPAIQVRGRPLRSSLAVP